MTLFSLDTPDAGDEALASVGARCYLALGRLDGAVAYAAPAVLQLFALLLVRRTLARSLAAAGYLFTEATFEAWLSRVGGPPQGGPGSAVPAPALAAAVLAELRAAKWPVLAEAADLVVRAAAHLARGEGAPGGGAAHAGSGAARRKGQGSQPHEDPGAVIEAARAWLSEGDDAPAARDAPPLSVVADRLAAAPALFVPIERGATVLETDAGPVTVPLATAQAHGWALGLVLGGALAARGVLRRPLPFAGVIAPEVLRRDCEADVRHLRLAHDIGEAAHAMLGDLETARRLVARADVALADARSTSRAPVVFALIAGLGVATRAQVADTFGMTAAGADGVLARLQSAGLIARRPGRAGRFGVAAGSGAGMRDNAGRVAEALEATGVGEFDAAIADLDRLLVRSLR